MAVFFLQTNSSSSQQGDHTGIMTEVVCESENTCDYEQYSYKGLTAQWMGATQLIAPVVADNISPLLKSSAEGAANQCSGGENNTHCGSRRSGPFDRNTGIGQQLSAMNIILANLAVGSKRPVTLSWTSSASNATTSTPSSTASSSGQASASPPSSQPSPFTGSGASQRQFGISSFFGIFAVGCALCL